MNQLDSSANPSLRARLFQGLGAQGFGQAAQFLIRFSEVPLLLSFWGIQLYGEWLMLSAIPTYLSIGDGGFASAACRDMTMRTAAEDRKGALSVFQSTWSLLLMVSLAMCVLAFLCVAFLPLRDWLGFEVMTRRQVQIVLLLLTGHVLIGFQGGLINGGFWVAGRYPLGMTLTATIQLLEFVGLAAAVALGGGPIGAATGFLSGRAVGTIIMWLYQHRVSPWLSHGFVHATLGEIKRLTAPAFASLAFPLGNALNIQGIRLVVGLALGAAAVSVFVPLRTMTNLALQPRAIINRLIEPELGLAFGAGDLPLIRSFFIKSCRLSFWACLLSVLVVGGLGGWILPIWTSGKIAMHWPAFILLLAGVPLNALWYTALMLPYSTNRHGRAAIFYILVYGIFALGLSYVLSFPLGVGGAGLALLLAECGMALIVIADALQKADMGINEWMRAVLDLSFFNLGRATGSTSQISAK